MRLLDSNLFILEVRGDAEPPLPAAMLRAPYGYSVVTRIEVLGFRRITPADEWDLSELLDGGEEFPLTAPVVNEAIRLRQNYRLQLGDAIIAATALVHALPLLTRNVADFRHIPELDLLPA